MVTIVNPQLHVDEVDREPGERRLRVTYDIEIPPNDPAIGMTLREHVTVSARDEHDAPTFPSDMTTHLRGEVRLDRGGSASRTLTTDVHRVDLDVEQDWWRIDEGGGFEPIAELADHLGAEVTLMLGDDVVARSVTPTVTGSWGALGAD